MNEINITLREKKKCLYTLLYDHDLRHGRIINKDKLIEKVEAWIIYLKPFIKEKSDVWEKAFLETEINNNGKINNFKFTAELKNHLSKSRPPKQETITQRPENEQPFVSWVAMASLNILKKTKTHLPHEFSDQYAEMIATLPPEHLDIWTDYIIKEFN